MNKLLILSIGLVISSLSFGQGTQSLFVASSSLPDSAYLDTITTFDVEIDLTQGPDSISQQDILLFIGIEVVPDSVVVLQVDTISGASVAPGFPVMHVSSPIFTSGLAQPGNGNTIVIWPIHIDFDTDSTYKNVYFFGPQETPIIDIEHLRLFPNPATNFVQIENLPLKEEPCEIRVIDLSGKVVAKFDQANTLDLSPLSSGLYLIQIVDQGRVVAHSKLIKR